MYGGVLARRHLQSTKVSGQVLDDNERADLHEAARKGALAELTVSRYNDWFVSTTNARSPDEQVARAGGGVPDPHPCAVNAYSGGAVADENVVRDDLDGLLNCCQCLKCRPEGYCKKKVRAGGGAPAEFKSRFGYPFPHCETTCLEFDAFRDGKVQAKIATKRNDGSINSRCRLVLSHWRANVDLQLIFD